MNMRTALSAFAAIIRPAPLLGGENGGAVNKFNNIVVIPIRSGIGLRLGANVGYLKFTPTPTWNPF